MSNLLLLFAQNRILTEITGGLAVLVVYLIVRELIWHASKTRPGQVAFVLIPVIGALLLYLHLYLYGIVAILIFVFIIIVIVSKRRQGNRRYEEVSYYD